MLYCELREFPRSFENNVTRISKSNCHRPSMMPYQPNRKHGAKAEAQQSKRAEPVRCTCHHDDYRVVHRVKPFEINASLDLAHRTSS